MPLARVPVAVPSLFAALLAGAALLPAAPHAATLGPIGPRAAARSAAADSVRAGSLAGSPLGRNAGRVAPREPLAPGAVVVALRPGSGLRATPAGLARADAPAFAATLARFGLAFADDLRRASAPGSRTADVLRLRSDRAGFDPVAAAAALRGLPGVIAAAPDVRLQLALVPNDPGLVSQWFLGNSAAAIHAPAGWARETGSASVAIAILDTGIDLTHPDLAAKIWTNPGEIPGNGIDDDGDGYIDDVQGWDFGNNDADPEPEPVFDPIFGIDEGWHGTFVAGLAAAATDNGIGVAGVAWGCPVMALKVTDSAGNIDLSSLASALDYAIAKHAKVINMSLGTSDASAAGVMQALVDDAFNADVVVVAAAGNDGTDTPNWPAACDSVLSVASTNASNVRSDFSNWGWYVNICAPGETMWSCISQNYVFDEGSQLFFEVLWGWDTVNPYMSGDGTSFAAPIVSGAAALLRSRAPSLHAGEVMNQLIADGDVKAYDNPIGPKINLDRTLSGVLAAGPAPPGGPLAFSPPAPNPATSAAMLAFALPRAARVRLAIVDAAGRRVRRLLEGGRGAGPQSVAWDLRDDSGRPVSAGLYLASLESDGVRATRRIAVLR